MQHGSAPPRPIGRPPRPSGRPPRPPGKPPRPEQLLFTTTTPAFVTTRPAANQHPAQHSFVVFLDKEKNHENNLASLTQVPSTQSFSSQPQTFQNPASDQFQTNADHTLLQDSLQAPQPPVTLQKLSQKKPGFRTGSNHIKPDTARPEKLETLPQISPPSLQEKETPAGEGTAGKSIPSPSVEGRKQKPFQAFQQPQVFQGKLVSLPVSAISQPTTRPVAAQSSGEDGSSVETNPNQEDFPTDLAKQQFTAFKNPTQPSVGPAATLGRQSGESGSNLGGGRHNEQEAITGVESTDTGTGVKTILTKEKQTTRNPKAVSALPASRFERVPVKTRKQTTKVKQIDLADSLETGKIKPISFTSSEHLESKRLIFKDSTIAVSPGSILVAETFTSSSLNDAQPMVQIPFVIEGTAGEGEQSGKDITVPIVIEEKEKHGQVKFMTEDEFENLFGTESPRTNNLVTSSAPQNQFFQVSAVDNFIII